MNTKSKKGKISYGTVELTDEELSREATRRRISIMVPLDVLDGLRAMAAKESIGYQTLVNRVLREYVSRETVDLPSIKAQLGRIERALKQVSK